MRLRDKKYLQSFKERKCCIYKTSHDTVAHHLRIGTDGGTGIKPSDCYCIPLSHKAHSELHNQGEKTFLKKYSHILTDNPIEYAERLYKEYLDK